MTSNFSSMAFSSIFSAGTITPKSTIHNYYMLKPHLLCFSQYHEHHLLRSPSVFFGIAFPAPLLFLLNKWQQVCYRFFHHTSTFYHLRQNIFLRQTNHLHIHSIHQRTFNHFDGIVCISLLPPPYRLQ